MSYPTTSATVVYGPNPPLPGFSYRTTRGDLSALERLYPRICENVLQLWHKPEAQPYLDSLIVDERYDRQGFPLEVIEELLFLSELNWLRENDNDPRLATPTASERFTFAPANHQGNVGDRLSDSWVLQ
jgi:hypothetical protein